ncbi:hypothetical protein BLA60_28950 [Actinophytocola xinjiangensis]|uniref:Uncharacterized protein n=1 Tax=Actinophytocola xinjiangensis TaxID=485602 RepID=A0A7Z0WKN1_9PSEU|nr:hypothetical protein [Actinophytocola xinjiangensis]OLF07230.1 hypothetical protein BLA60_28950 [Actinophytocola xinjiangensis]
MEPQPPPEQDPFRSMWQMSPVADARAGGKAGRKRTGLRLGAGLIGGLVAFTPFGLVTSAFWGWWQGESNWGASGWAVVIIGLGVGALVGGFVASESGDQ